MNAKNLLTLLIIASLILGAGLLLADGDSGGEGSGGAGEESGTTLSLNETFDTIRNGVRLVMFYDATTQTFIGVVVNTTTQTIPAVRVEVHLSNGVELGPTIPGDLAPGETRLVELSAASPSGFDGWSPHAESGESGGEHGSDGEGGGEHGSSGEESGATLTLTDTFDAIRNGVRLVMSYDAASQSFIGVVENTTAQAIQAVRVEVHLSNGVELGPTTPVDLQPGESIPVELAGSSTPFDGWTPHAESGPMGSDSGAESGGEGSEGGGGEGSEGAGGEHGGSGESGSG